MFKNCLCHCQTPLVIAVLGGQLLSASNCDDIFYTCTLGSVSAQANVFGNSVAQSNALAINLRIRDFGHFHLAPKHVEVVVSLLSFKHTF